MSVKISHPLLPNIYKSQISDLQKLAESKNKLRSFMLTQKITKQQNLGNLEELYKPILNNQSKQISEVQNTNVKLDENRAELTNILNQLVTNGVLTRGVSSAIADKLDKIDNDVLTKIFYAVKNKPEAIALLKTLSKYPIVVYAIKYGDLTYLTNDIDKKIFNTLEFIDNDILKVLVDYYTNISQNDDVFRIDSRAESQLIDEDVTKIDDASIIDS